MGNRRFGHAAVLAACSLFILMAYAGPKDFWVTKPYTDWTAKEVDKILIKDSPWTHVLLRNAPSSGGAISDTGAGGGNSKGGGGGGGGGRNSGGGGGGSEGPPPIYMNWYARPIREAVARQMMLSVPNTSKEQIAGILNRKSEFYEVMLRGFLPGGGGGRGSRGVSGDAAAALTKFKEDTCLQKKDGTKIPLANLIMPRTRTDPAFLQFAKEIDGKPTCTLEDKEITLVIRIDDNIFKYKFKFADMMINDKLEL